MDINLILGLLVRRGQLQWHPRRVCCQPKHQAAPRNAYSLHLPSFPLHLLRRQRQQCTGFQIVEVHTCNRSDMMRLLGDHTY